MLWGFGGEVASSRGRADFCLSALMPCKIELRYAHGWADAGWTDETVDGQTRPTRFATVADARVGLGEFLEAADAAVVSGDMCLGHAPEEYRIVEVTQ